VVNSSLTGNSPIAIGICAERSHINTLPGWKDSAAYGYHGDDGKIYTGRGDRTGISDTKAPFGEGDTVGCCVNLEDRLLFFTRMGKIIGTYPLSPHLSLAWAIKIVTLLWLWEEV
jgi:hypothetical protein